MNLLEAVHYSNREEVELSLRSGSDVNEKTCRNGQTALMIAAIWGRTEIADLLVRSNADVNVTDNDGDTALKLAARYGRTEIADLLVRSNADVNVKTNYDGWTALIQAADYGRTEIADLLVRSNADVNVKGRGFFKGTPLHLASQKGHLDVALLLLNKGADPNAKDGYGRTPGQVAGSNCCWDETSKDRAKAIRIFINRWPVLMTVLMLRELSVFHLGNIDLAMMDLFEFIGDEEDFV